MKFQSLSKRGFSLFLTFVMCLSLLGVQVFAADAVTMSGEEFLALADENGTIVLANDVVLTGAVQVTENIAIELGDFIIAMGSNGIQNMGELTITAGMGGIQSDDVFMENYGVLVLSGGNYAGSVANMATGDLTIEDGTAITASGYVLTNNGTATIQGGTFEGGSKKALIKGEDGSLTIEGGSFVNTNGKPLVAASGETEITITGGDIDCGLAAGSNVTVTGGNFPAETEIADFLNQDELTAVVKDENGKQTILTGDDAVEAIENGADAYLGGGAVEADRFAAVMLDRNDGSAPEKRLVVKGTSITLENLTREGCYAFVGWLRDNVPVEGEALIEEDTSFTAQWNASHNTYEVAAVDATCVADGHKAYQLCYVCEKMFDENGAELSEADIVLPKLDHTWNDGVVTKEATTTEEGVMTYTCTYCSETRTESIPRVPGTSGNGSINGGGSDSSSANIQDEDVPLAGVLPFDDATEANWYYDAVRYVYEKGLMSGTSDNVFAPHSSTSRAMIVTILYRMEGEPEAAASAFSDVSPDAYYAAAVAWAAENGIVSGYSETQFGPNDNITREQLAVILYNFAAFKGLDVTGRAELESFSDAAQVSEFAVEALRWAVDAGLMSGVDNVTLAAGGTATRAQVASLLMRFCENQLAR